MQASLLGNNLPVLTLDPTSTTDIFTCEPARALEVNKQLVSEIHPPTTIPQFRQPFSDLIENLPTEVEESWHDDIMEK